MGLSGLIISWCRVTNIVIIGEAWGAEEERERTPFIGKMSWQLTPMLEEAGITRADCFLTNVFNLRYDGKIEIFCGPKSEALSGFGALYKGKYVRKEFGAELDRLAEELIEVNPNVIIAMGNTPLWALTGKIGIGKLRGTTLISSHTVQGFKVLPTYHPAAIIHSWELRPVTVLDLMKARREAEFPEVRRPKREIWIEPEISDLEEFYARYIRGCEILSVDIETAGSFITCIGFAPSPGVAIVIPFADGRKVSRSYWSNAVDEWRAWELIKDILNDRGIRKTFQNGLYDIAFLWRSYGIKVFGATEDTMLLHHSLQPEALKGLAFLGSVYCDEGAWKDMRKFTTTIKRED